MPRVLVLVRPFVVMLALAFALGAECAHADEVQTGPPPAWVTLRTPDLDFASPRADARYGGYQLLLDGQINSISGERFYQQVTRIVNQEGVSNFSDLTVSYDPSYASLEVHWFRIHRNGQVFDKLHDHEIRQYQREQLLEGGLYDGHITAVVNLTDVRAGDVIDYAYTVSGVNPLFVGHVGVGFTQQSYTPIRALYVRLIVDPAVELFQHTFNDGQALAPSTGPYGTEYTWDAQNIPPLAAEVATPIWWEPQPRVSLTSFPDWCSVAEWAMPLYELAPADHRALAAIASEALVGDTRDQQILSAIRFVQDEVRYLGREEGLWGFQPRKPALCFERRYGDCKDRSLLLVALLHQLDVVAFPVLVSTAHREHLAQRAPARTTFDHCIAGFEYDNDILYVDPTYSHQGGGIENSCLPDFGVGLHLRPDCQGLQPFPSPEPVRMEVRERFEAAAIGVGDINLTVETRYYAQAADERRAGIAAGSLEEIGQISTHFYCAAYPGIEQSAPLEVIDTSRETRNVLVMKEHYVIHDPWQVFDDDSSAVYFQVYPLELDSCVNLVPSLARTAPYDAGSMINLHVATVVHMPGAQPVAFTPFDIQGDSYSFRHTAQTEGDVNHIEYEYKLWDNIIPAEDTPAFLKAHGEMSDLLGVYITNTDLSGDSGGVSPAVLVAVLAVIAGSIAAWRVWRRYDPVAGAPVLKPRGIGGWLILPAISVVLNPLFVLAQVVASGYLFAPETWQLAEQGFIEASHWAWGSFVAFEITGNALTFVFSILLAWVFFARRTSTPRLMVIFLLSSAIFVTVDLVIAIVLVGGGAESDDVGGVVGSWIGVAIWVPYFMSSLRVRETFVFRADRSFAALDALREPRTDWDSSRPPIAIIHIPHASRVVPPDVRDTLLLDDERLEQEIEQITDHYSDDLFALSDPQAHALIYPVSRLVVDPERFLDDAAEPMSRHGMGAVYTRTLSGDSLREDLSPEDRRQLLAAYYHPHHEQLQEATRAALEAYGRALIIDCHSYPERPFPFEDPIDPRPELCIGTDAFHTPKWLYELARTLGEDLGLSVGRNSPFAGSLVPSLYFGQDARVLSVMLELRRDVYMDEETGEKLPIYIERRRRLRAGLMRMIEESCSM